AELGRQPRRARKFFLEYQDRIMFGTDSDPEEAMYANYFRWLETPDEYFEYAGYPGQGRWEIYAQFKGVSQLGAAKPWISFTRSESNHNVSSNPPDSAHSFYYWEWASPNLAAARKSPLLRPSRRDPLPRSKPQVSVSPPRPMRSTSARPSRSLCFLPMAISKAYSSTVEHP